MFRFTPAAAAVALLVSGAVTAEEVNPFTGAHGKIEELRLQTDETAQRNKLMEEKIALERNKFMLENIGGQLATEGQGKTAQPASSTTPVPLPAPVVPAVPVQGPPSQTAIPAPAPAQAQAKAPKTDMKLTGVIETSAGMRAVITQGERDWTVCPGARVGKLTVRSIGPDRVALSNGRILWLAQGEHPVSAGGGRTPVNPLAGPSGDAAGPVPMGASDEMKAILNVTGANPPPPGLDNPVPAKFN